MAEFFNTCLNKLSLKSMRLALMGRLRRGVKEAPRSGLHLARLFGESRRLTPNKPRCFLDLGLNRAPLTRSGPYQSDIIPFHARTIPWFVSSFESVTILVSQQDDSQIAPTPSS